MTDNLAYQKKVIEALIKPDSYAQDQINLKQTHISFVLITDSVVYKVKKAVNFGFLDFSTLEKRHLFCKKELEINKRLCGDMYLEVVPITQSESGIIELDGDGKIIEYAVKMRKISENSIMTRLLEKGKVDYNLVDRIAKIIAEFHSKAKTNSEIGEFGSFLAIETNWRENFDQTQEFIDETISKEKFELIRQTVNDFLRQNSVLFAKRVIDGRIKECHGDIHSGNIFLADRIYIFDAIEFNERFRNCDVASEIAFLAMDLDYKNQTELSRFFVNSYIQYSGDQEINQVLNFYKCYRAYVRGKVASFKLKDPNIDPEEKIEAKKEAKAYFDLALKYAMKV